MTKSGIRHVNQPKYMRRIHVEIYKYACGKIHSKENPPAAGITSGVPPLAPLNKLRLAVGVHTSVAAAGPPRETTLPAVALVVVVVSLVLSLSVNDDVPMNDMSRLNVCLSSGNIGERGS